MTSIKNIKIVDINILILILFLSFFFEVQVSFTQEKNQNYNWPQVLLGKEDIGFLPTSPFYFVKEWRRGIRKLFTFDSVKKAELELGYSDEKLVETAKVVDENCGENQDSQKIQCNKEVIQKAFNNYFESQQRLAKRIESLDEKNPNVEKLLSKLGGRVILHQALFDELISNMQEIELRKAVHDMSMVVIRNIPGRRVGYEPENIEQAIDKLPYREGVRELKALEILTRLEENLAEEVKEGIESVKENIEKILIEGGKIQAIREGGKTVGAGQITEIIKRVPVQNGTSEGGELQTDLLFIDKTPFEEKVLDEVLDRLEEKAKALSSVSEKPNVVNIEAVKNLKKIIEEAKSATVSSSASVTCPTIAPDTSKGKEECLKAAKYLDDIYPGCNYAKICEEISEQKLSLECGPIPERSANWRCIDGIWRNISQCGQIRCLRYDPVCGADGKTYSCGEADAVSCGVKVAYKGECQPASFVPPIKKCQPRPVCLDATSPCLLPEPAEGWCPSSSGEIFCTQEWDPVCGTNNETYSNECTASRAGVDIQYKGECKLPSLTPTPTESQQIQSTTR